MIPAKTSPLLFAFLVAARLSAGAAVPVAAETYEAASPDRRLVFRFLVAEDVRYALDRDGIALIEPSAIGLTLADGRVLGANPKIADVKRRSVRDRIRPAVPEKRAVIPDAFEELTLDFKGGFSLVARVYDDGAAYRFVTRLPGEVKVLAEEAVFRFAGDPPAYIPFASGLQMSFENTYTRLPLSEVGASRFGFVPVLVDVPDGPNVVLTEADLRDYPGMFLAGNDAGRAELRGLFAPYPLEEKLKDKSDRTVVVTKRAEYIAATSGRRAFPWRVIAVAERDGALIENDIVYRLAPATILRDTAWIKPGKVAWDWWNANTLFGVGFASGVNTATYRHYIDFAARHGIAYVILDEGWSAPDDLFRVNPEVDMDALAAYARERNVGLILWCVWLTLDRQLDQALDRFAAWGAKGVKVDFMDRDDQKTVGFYWKVAEAAAKRRLIVDFHGAYKPTGLRRAYPNVLTREGVLGLEYGKWSDRVTPEHDLLIPFIRMLAGPMDFTPGAMVNAARQDFRAVFNAPMSQGTRCHQLAMYVIYESPLQMLADSPSRYDGEPEAMEFLAKVPTTWDETKVLDARVSDYAVVARRKGEEWFLGAMTDWTPRTLEIRLDFLGEGGFEAVILGDGVNASRYGSDFKREKIAVRKGDKLSLDLAPGGGWAAVLSPENRRE
ncbi:MAG: glycoside hydrolase family 97 protein [Candidatus Aminicenantes bacterium]|nr:glycoside hydrolase family 97 protein [Candidatus Aminicenantes bacterium]